MNSGFKERIHKQQNRLQGWHTVDKPINSAHIFRGTIACQINAKYNPTYCLVLQLGIDPRCSDTVSVLTAALKPLQDRFPNKGM